MKAIFLDVDGVLTTFSYHNPDTNHINPEKVQVLRQIVERTGAKIVLTSTWKMGYGELPTDDYVGCGFCEAVKRLDGRSLAHDPL